MNRRFTTQGMTGMMLSPETRGLAIYRNGRIALRDSGGHPGGTGSGDADDDSDDDLDDDDEDDDDDSEDSDDDDEASKKSKKKKSKDADDDDDATVPAWKHDKLTARLAAADKAKGELEKQLNALKANGVKDEDLKREIEETKVSVAKTQADNVSLRMQIAFLSTSVKGVVWNDPSDAMRLMDFAALDPEDGRIDPRAMRSAIRKLAKEKPYLLAATKSDDAEDGDADDKGTASTGRTSTSGRPANRRRGTGATKPSRDDLMKRFPGAFR